MWIPVYRPICQASFPGHIVVIWSGEEWARKGRTITKHLAENTAKRVLGSDGEAKAILDPPLQVKQMWPVQQVAPLPANGV